MCGATLLCAKALAAWYKEFEKSRQAAIEQKGKEDAQKAADEVMQQYEASAEQARADATRAAELERQNQERLIADMEAAEAAWRRADEEARNMRQQIEQQVTNILKHDPSIRQANECAGVLARTSSLLEAAKKEFQRLLAVHQQYKEPIKVLPAEMLHDLRMKRHAVQNGYHTVNVMLHLASQEHAPAAPSPAPAVNRMNDASTPIADQVEEAMRLYGPGNAPAARVIGRDGVPDENFGTP